MIRLVLTSVLFLLILTSTAASQFVFNFTGAGARAQGMGNAFIAVSDDASAASWNPAGLTAHEKLLMGFDIDKFSPDNSYINGQDFELSTNFSSISQLSIIAPLRFKGRPLVFAFSYSKVTEEFWNDGVSFDTILTYDNFRDTSDMHVIAESWQHPDLAVLNFAVGTKVSKSVSVGFSANIYLGSGVGRTDQNVNIPVFLDQSLGRQTAIADSIMLVLDTTIYSGINFTFSSKYDGDKIDIGVVIKSPFDLSAETDRKIFSDVYYNGLLERASTQFIDNQLVKTEIPWSLAVGVAFTPIENLLLATDFEYSGYSGSLVKVRDSLHIISGSQNEEFYTSTDYGWEDVIRVRAGFEYQLHLESDLFPIIPIRAGFNSVTIPTRNIPASESVASSIGATALEKSTQTDISVGLGVKWSQIFLDASLTWTSTDLPVLGGSTGQGYDNSSTKFAFGFTGYF